MSSSEEMTDLDLSRVVRIGPISSRSNVFLESPRTDRGTVWVRKVCGKRSLEPDIHSYLSEKQRIEGVNHVVSLIKVEAPTLVMEKCVCGDMYRFLMNHPLCLTQSFVFEWIHDIGRAIAFMHRNNTFHNDIKPENCFLTLNENDEIVCKLGDFGLSRFEHHRDSRTHAAGTMEYAAPEVIRSEERDPYAPDVWSFVATTHAIHMSNRLELHNSKVHIDHRIKRDPRLAPLYALISIGARPRWRDRPKMKQLLKCDYFSAYGSTRIGLFEFDCLPQMLAI